MLTVKLRLLANGLTSGAITVTLVEGARTYVRIPASGNPPFQSPAYEFEVQIVHTASDDLFVYGMAQLRDSSCAILGNYIPFVYYNGDEWPQAPIGMIHWIERHKVYMGHEIYQFSLLFESAKR